MSNIRTIQVLIKLLPSIIALRKDRKQWVKQEGKNIDLEKFRKNAHKVLNTFITLGPVYIKLGQWLSSRADILPQPYMEELAKLQDDVPAAPFIMNSRNSFGISISSPGMIARSHNSL